MVICRGQFEEVYVFDLEHGSAHTLWYHDIYHKTLLAFSGRTIYPQIIIDLSPSLHSQNILIIMLTIRFGKCL